MNDNENMPRRFTDATKAERLTSWALLICAVIPVVVLVLKFFK